MVSVLELYCEKCAAIKCMLCYIANGVWMLQNNNWGGGVRLNAAKQRRGRWKAAPREAQGIN
jgi:hypothetical protein